MLKCRQKIALATGANVALTSTPLSARRLPRHKPKSGRRSVRTATCTVCSCQKAVAATLKRIRQVGVLVSTAAFQVHTYPRKTCVGSDAANHLGRLLPL